MSAIIENTEIRSSRSTRTPKVVKREASTDVSFIESIKSYFIKHRMAKAWSYRNLSHGEVFVEALEIEHIIFQQNCFIEATKAIEEKLVRLHFEEQTVFPEVEQYKQFCTTYYNANHNIAICLYPTKHKDAIITAQKIADKTTKDGPSGIAIFLNTINVLVYK